MKHTTFGIQPIILGPFWTEYGLFWRRLAQIKEVEKLKKKRKREKKDKKSVNIMNFVFKNEKICIKNRVHLNDECI